MANQGRLRRQAEGVALTSAGVGSTVAAANTGRLVRTYERAVAGQYGRDRVAKSEKVKINQKDRRKYLTSKDRARNQAAAITAGAASAGVMLAGGPVARSGLKDIRRSNDMARESRSGRVPQSRALREGPRRVKPNREGVYDIRGEKRKPSNARTSAEKKALRTFSRGRAKLVAGVLSPVAGLGTALGSGVALDRNRDKKVRERKLADMKRQSRG